MKSQMDQSGIFPVCRHTGKGYLPFLCNARPENLARPWENELRLCKHDIGFSLRDIMAGKRAKHCSCSVFGCINQNKSIFLVPSSDSLRNQYFNFIFSGNVPTQLPKVLHVCAKHFTDDCFLNLGQYRAGLAQRLKIKSGSLPTLLGSASKLGQVSQLTLYDVVALMYSL